MLGKSHSLVLAFASTVLQSAIAVAAPPSPEYRLIWQDEFNGTELDLDKWSYRYLGPRRGGINAEDAIVLNGKGFLEIVTSEVGDEFHTGMIGTQDKFEARYGYWETRVRLQEEPGHWFAFWLQSPDMRPTETPGDPATMGAEIDVVEYPAIWFNDVLQTVIWGGYGHGSSASQRTTIPGLNDGFHTFGVEWTEDEYIFYVNDRETWRTSQGLSHRPQYVILSLEVAENPEGWVGDVADGEFPDRVVVDYVRVYQK